MADFAVFTRQSMPPQLRQVLVIDAETGAYLPPVFINEFWRPKSALTPINETVTELPLRLDFSCTSLMRWQLTVQARVRVRVRVRVGVRP